MENNNRRNGDRPLMKLMRWTIFSVTPMAVAVTVYFFTHFATVNYVDAENEEQGKNCDVRQQSIDQKLDFLVENVGNSNAEIKDNRRRLEEEIKRDRDRRENQ